jgi:hypothetical protein
MNFFSNLVSGVKNTVSSAYNAVKGVAQSIGNFISPQLTSPTSLTGAALNSIGNKSGMNFPVGQNMTTAQTAKANQIIASGGADPAAKNPYNISFSSSGAPFTSITPGGSSSAYIPPAPTSFKAGTKTSYGASGSWGASDYSSPSYSSNLAASSFYSPSPVSQTVSASAVGAGTPSIIMPSSPTPTNYSSNAFSGNVALGANPTSGLFDMPGTMRDKDGNVVPVKEDKNDARKRMEDLIKELKPPASEADSYIRARNESKEEEAKLKRNETQNKINAITSQRNADLLKIRGVDSKEGVVEAVYGGQQAEIEREATIKLLPLQAQLAVDQGNLELAQEKTTTLFKIYANDAKNSADFYNKQVEKIYDLASTDEKREYDEKIRQKNFNADVIKTDAKAQNDAAMKLLEKGSVAGYRALTSIRPPTNVNSPTFAEDYQNYREDIASALSQYGASLNEESSGDTLNILDVARYNELYPEANVTAGDTEASANAKVAAINTPEAKTRSLIVAAKDNGSSYKEVLAEIKSDSSIKDKTLASQIAKEVYEVGDETTTEKSGGLIDSISSFLFGKK